MTLQEWHDENPQVSMDAVNARNVPENICWFVAATAVMLWHLSDFVVSTATGGGVYLVKRPRLVL